MNSPRWVALAVGLTLLPAATAEAYTAPGWWDEVYTSGDKEPLGAYDCVPSTTGDGEYWEEREYCHLRYPNGHHHCRDAPSGAALPRR